MHCDSKPCLFNPPVIWVLYGCFWKCRSLEFDLHKFSGFGLFLQKPRPPKNVEILKGFVHIFCEFLVDQKFGNLLKNISLYGSKHSKSHPGPRASRSFPYSPYSLVSLLPVPSKTHMHQLTCNFQLTHFPSFSSCEAELSLSYTEKEKCFFLSKTLKFLERVQNNVYWLWLSFVFKICVFCVHFYLRFSFQLKVINIMESHFCDMIDLYSVYLRLIAVFSMFFCKSNSSSNRKRNVVFPLKINSINTDPKKETFVFLWILTKVITRLLSKIEKKGSFVLLLFLLVRLTVF